MSNFKSSIHPSIKVGVDVFSPNLELPAYRQAGELIAPLFSGLDILSHPSDGVFYGGSRRENGFHSLFYKAKDILFRDDASSKDNNVFCAFLLEELDDSWEKVIVCTGQAGQPNPVHIFLDGRGYDLFWRLVKASIDDFEAGIPKSPRDDLRSTIMTVQSGFCDQNSDSTLRIHRHPLKGFKVSKVQGFQ